MTYLSPEAAETVKRAREEQVHEFCVLLLELQGTQPGSLQAHEIVHRIKNALRTALELAGV